MTWINLKFPCVYICDYKFGERLLQEDESPPGT